MENIKIYPDKKTHKHTTTYKLREDLIGLSKDFDEASYLEIGIAAGFTIMSLIGHYKTLHGCDTNKGLVDQVREQTNDVSVCHGDIFAMDKGKYDVVFIDGRHDYDSILSDTLGVLQMNTASSYKIVYHDYGLVAHPSRNMEFGVKRFCTNFYQEIEFLGEPKDWNPAAKDPATDWEAACVSITSINKETLLEKMKNESR